MEMIDGGDDALFHVLFVTTPSRLGTPRFGAYFAKARIDRIHLKMVLKRREPIQLRAADGVAAMGWTPRCSEDDFAQGARRLAERGADAWINVEGELRSEDEELLGSVPGLGALVSGHGLDPAAARDMIGRLPVATRIVLALENEAMMLGAMEFISSGRLVGLVIGTSYLSESSRIYDQMGLEKYRSLMRGLAKKAASVGIRPYTTSNYCTFEASGLGDKNKDFVGDQVDFVSKHGTWGSLTRFYSHLDVAQAARMRQGRAKGEAT